VPAAAFPGAAMPVGGLAAASASALPFAAMTGVGAPIPQVASSQLAGAGGTGMGDAMIPARPVA